MKRVWLGMTIGWIAGVSCMFIFPQSFGWWRVLICFTVAFATTVVIVFQ